MSTVDPDRSAHEVLDHAREAVARADHDLAGRVDEAEERHPRSTATGRVLAAVVHEQSAERVGLAASGAAFWLVISALPTAIASLTVFGLVVSPERVATDLGHLTSAVPGSLGALFADQLRRVAASDHAGLSLGLVVSLLLAIWSASAGIYNLDRAIRVAYGLPAHTYVQARSRALVGAVVAVLLFGLTAVATSAVIAHSSPALAIAGGLVAVVAIAACVAALYRFAIGRPMTLRSLLPGALASAVGVVLVTFAFGVYVALSKRFAAVYGAFGGIVVGMLAVYFAVYVVLLGAVLNRQLAARAPQP